METKEPAPTGDALIQRLVVANPAPGTESNNPGRDLGPLSTFQVRPMFENLIGFDADVGALVPQLATGWSVEPDGISVRFLLRKGVPFHGDNGDMTSRDIVLHPCADHPGRVNTPAPDPLGTGDCGRSE